MRGGGAEPEREEHKGTGQDGADGSLSAANEVAALPVLLRWRLAANAATRFGRFCRHRFTFPRISRIT